MILLHYGNSRFPKPGCTPLLRQDPSTNAECILNLTPTPAPTYQIIRPDWNTVHIKAPLRCSFRGQMIGFQFCWLRIRPYLLPPSKNINHHDKVQSMCHWLYCHPPLPMNLCPVKIMNSHSTPSFWRTKCMFFSIYPENVDKYRRFTVWSHQKAA